MERKGKEWSGKGKGINTVFFSGDYGDSTVTVKGRVTGFRRNGNGRGSGRQTETGPGLRVRWRVCLYMGGMGSTT